MTLPACDLTIAGATVLPFDAAWSTLEDCDVVVAGGRIAALGRGRAGEYAARRTIDGRGLVVTPGLCNAHTHSSETLARGLADAQPLDRWLASVWGALDQIEPAAIELAVMLAAAEMLHGGVTAVVDHFRQTPMTAAALDVAAGAWARSGLSATLAIMLRDRAVPPGRSVPPPDVQLDLVRRAAAAAGDRVRFALGPSAPTRCSDEFLRAIDAAARARGLLVHMHCDETRGEAAAARERFRTSAIGHLDRLGCLGPHVTLAHAVWIDAGDIERLAASRAGVVHNPASNLRLGSGRAPVEELLHAGVRVAVGTDGAASNDTQNVLEAVKLAVLLPRSALADPARWPTARDGLAMATAAPAALFRMGSGRVEVGAVADLAAFDADAPPLVPANDLHAQLALGGCGLHARHVIAGGELVLADGAIRSFDEADVAAQARWWRAGVHV